MFAGNLLSKGPSKFLKQLKTKKILLAGCRNCTKSLDAKLPGSYETPFFWSQVQPEKLRLDMATFLDPINEQCRYERRSSLELKRLDQINSIFDNQEHTINQKIDVEENHSSGYSSTSTLAKHVLPLQDFTQFQDMDKLLLSKRSNAMRKAKRTLVGAESKLSKCLLPGQGMKRETNTSLCSKTDNATLFNILKEQKMSDKLPGSDNLTLDNVADALNEQWLMLFTSNVDLSLFSDNVFFDNTALRLKTRGIKLYKLQVLMFKWITNTFWADPSLQILKFTRHTDDKSIRIRWQINGKPRILYPLALIGRTPSLRFIDFFSVLHIEDGEQITIHRLMKVVPTQESQKRNPLLSLLAFLGLSGTKMHLPSLQEEPVVPSSSSEPS